MAEVEHPNVQLVLSGHLPIYEAVYTRDIKCDDKCDKHHQNSNIGILPTFFRLIMIVPYTRISLKRKN